MTILKESKNNTPLCEEGEDQRWIRETLNGNHEAYGQLVQKHHPLLYHMACRVLKNPQEAEDVVQDGFIEAFRHLSSFKQHSQFSTWVYTIVLNRIRNRLRHAKVLTISSLDVRRATRDGDCVVEVMEKGPSIEESLQKKMELEMMRRAAEALPSIHRDIFILYYFDQHSIADIAAKINRPSGTVKVYLHRARKWLQEELDKKNIRPAASYDTADLTQNKTESLRV
jgi:RNA polymerase sigma-70 factor (ECF subfamily)